MDTLQKTWTDDDNYIIYSDGRVFSNKSKKFLKPSISNGYLAVHLRKKTHRVHRLVAISFVHNENPETQKTVDHIDQDKMNNDYTNLRWVDPKQNAENTKTLAFNTRKVAQYTLDDVLVATYDSAAIGARETGSSMGTITHCCGGRCGCVSDKDNIRFKWRYVMDKKTIGIPSGALPIPGYSKYYITKEGKVYSTFVKNFMKSHPNGDGYLRVSLKTPSTKITQSVHALVMSAFAKQPDNVSELQINHIDGDKQNNALSNLEYVTPSENSIHSCYVLKNAGKKVEMFSLETGTIINTFPSAVMASKHLERCQAHVANVCRGLKKSCAGYGLRYATL
jgi:hypothetical protein